MTTPTLNPVFADAVENELAALGTTNSQLQRHQRRARGLAATIGTVALAGALTGGALIIYGIPGETTTTPLGSVVSGTYTGTASVDLGDVPIGAGAVILEITCTTGGTMEIPLNGGSGGDTASWDCSNPIKQATTRITDGKLPDAGTTSITITADPGTRWSVVAQYANASTTAWSVNDNGQTYGVPNDNGLPDLSAAQATNGKLGYILETELSTAVDGSINVYDSDGTTILGQFPIGDN